MGINSLLRILLIIVFFFPFRAFTQVQNGKEIVVEVSKVKTVINGNTYYLHTVKKGENIYRISLAYGVTQKDVVIANPEILSGVIKEGQVLKIPSGPSAPRNVQQIEYDKFIYHIAEEGQTIYSLTQQYKITKEELFKYNPELEVSLVLQVGQVVRIPRSQNISPGPEKAQTIVNFIEHKVKRKETKYSISKKYEITVDELIAANPMPDTIDIQPGQILRIPVKTKIENVPVVPIVVKSDTTILNKPVTVVPCDTYTPFSETYNVAMLFPLCIEENLLAMIDSANVGRESEKPNIENNEIYQRTKNIVGFYNGALLAIDTLKKAGMSLKLYTYDTCKDTQKISQILSKPEMTKMDLIIGPFFTEAVEKVAKFALTNRIKLVSPVSIHSNILKDNPYIFQVIPNDSVNADAMLNYIASLPNKNIVLVCNNNPEDKAIINLYRRKLFANDFKEYNYKENDNQLNSYLIEKVDNIVVIPSEDQNLINDIFALLNIAARTYSIKVIGLPVCTMFTNSKQDYFHNLEFHYCTSFYTDFNSPYVKGFLSKYKMHYFSEPYYHHNNYPYFNTKEGFNFALLGYDITFYFLSSIGRLGKNFENCIGAQKFDLLHANFNFERFNPGSGFLNKGVNILKYSKDYYITKVY